MSLMQRAIFISVSSLIFCFGSAFAQRRVPRAEPQDLIQRFSAQEDKCRDMVKSRKWKEAEAVCKVAVQLADQFTSDRELEQMGAYEMFGHVLMGQERYQEAITYYSRANEIARPRLNDTNAEVGRLYWDMGIAYHSLRNLDKAREFYRKAEKTYQFAYSKINPEEVTEDGIMIKQGYMRSLKQILQYHIRAAEQAEAAAEAAELKKQLENLP